MGSLNQHLFFTSNLTLHKSNQNFSLSYNIFQLQSSLLCWQVNLGTLSRFCFTVPYFKDLWITCQSQREATSGAVKHLLAMREAWVWSLGREDPLEKEMATHSSILAWRIPWMEECGRLQSMGSQRVGHDWGTSLSLSLSWITCQSQTP